MLLFIASEYQCQNWQTLLLASAAVYPGIVTIITSSISVSTSLRTLTESHMTLFCFFWHRFRGHGTHTHSSLTMFTFTQHLSLSHRRRWKPAQARCGWGSNSHPPATMFKITGHCLHCYTGLAGSRTVLSELRTQLPTVQCTGVQCSLLLVYKWTPGHCSAVQACAVHTTASYVNIDRACYVCSSIEG